MIITDVKTALEAAKAKNLSSSIPEDFCISHPKTKAVGSFVYRECGFTEYDPCCNICFEAQTAKDQKYYEEEIKYQQKQDMFYDSEY